MNSLCGECKSTGLPRAELCWHCGSQNLVDVKSYGLDIMSAIEHNCSCGNVACEGSICGLDGEAEHNE